MDECKKGSGKPNTSRRSRWLLRLAAILLGFSPLVGLELVLRTFGLPQRQAAIDPFVDLHRLRPLFEPANEPGKVAIGSQRLHLFSPVEFWARKPPGVYRIFALGGSTTQGEPYGPPTAFPEWLRLSLQAANPDREVEVINCGGLSYASYRVLNILREVLEYDPDLVVVYTGHNEFLEQRSYGSSNSGGNLDVDLGSESPTGFGGESLAVVASYLQSLASSRLSQFRSVQLIRRAVYGPAERSETLGRQRTEMSAEVEALLDYEGGLEEYHRNDLWTQTVAEHFRWNLEQMCAECRLAKVPLLFVSPASNLLDTPPIKFEDNPELSASQRAAFDRVWSSARQVDSQEQVLLNLKQALAIDPNHSGCNYLMGRICFERDDYANSKMFLTRARDTDVCPLRAPSQLVDILQAVAGENRVPLLDAQALFAERSKAGIVGDRWLVDHVHPSVEGHQLLALALAEQIVAEELFLATEPNWQSGAQALFRQQLRNLGEEYFHRGKQRLAGLMLWAEGRAKKVREKDRD